jgi:uncharacterized protein YneF (UPF0154 family)
MQKYGKALMMDYIWGGVMISYPPIRVLLVGSVVGFVIQRRVLKVSLTSPPPKFRKIIKFVFVA